MTQTNLGFLADIFCNMVTFDTQSKLDQDVTPSTPGQSVFAEYLAGVCSVLGLENARADEHAYVYAELPANTEGKPAIGLIAHIDTSPSCSGKDIVPLITQNYDGGDIIFPNGGALRPSEFPYLSKYIGCDIISASGGTLLGADDKAGIAEILAAAKYFIDNPEVKHGAIKLCFPPDEEIGHGAELLDIDAFGADFAYTVDGGEAGEFEMECFNAARAVVTVTGVSTHPGSAKGILVNAVKIAAEFALSFPADEAPETTEKREGYYHVDSINGQVEKCVIDMILRDFDLDGLEKRKQTVLDVVKLLNEKHGDRISVEITDQYRNMVSTFEGKEEIIDLALNAIRQVGIEPIIQPIRGGTDGAALSLRGLPCPNIFTGGYNFHGPYEFIPLQSMEKARDVLINIIRNA